MTTILAIETSTEACSVALSVDSEVLYRCANEPRSHTQQVIPMVQAVLAEAGETVSQLDAIGVSIGPGSFTGLRIGFAVTQGLAYGADIPVVGVSSLQVMVQTYLRKNFNSEASSQSLNILSVLDARMNQYNCGSYRWDSSAGIELQQSVCLLDESELNSLLNERNPDVVIGDGDKLFATHSEYAERYCPLRPDARDLLDISLPLYAAGGAVAIDQLELVYLRGEEAWQQRKRLREANNVD